MQAFLYKCSFVLLFIFLCFTTVVVSAHANQYGTMCYATYGPWFVTPDLATYCNTTTTYNDIGGLSSEEQTAINTLTRMRIFSGTSPTTFSPNDRITRWQVAAVMSRYHIYIKRDWFSWDAANDPIPSQFECGNDCPVKNYDDTYLADVDYYDDGSTEMHTSLAYGWLRGGDCDSLYNPAVPQQNWSDSNDPSGYDSGIMVRVPHKAGTAKEFVRDKARCFGTFEDWRFGFHGVERAGAMYMYWTTFPYNGDTRNHTFYYCNYYSPVQSGSGSCEEAWNGSWYNFAGGGDSARAPETYNWMTRAEFAYQMYLYYKDVDDNNFCAAAQTGTLTGSSLNSDGQGNYCVIHADENSCTTPLTWNTSYTMNNTCNYAAVTKPGTYPYGTVGPDEEMGTGTSGTVTSDATTGPTDSKTYKLRYNFEFNNSYIAGNTFDNQLAQLSFSGRNTTGTISFPGGACTIPSTGTTCSQPISWNTSYITDNATVILRDTTNNIQVGTNTSGNTNYVISGPTTFTLYERGVAIATQTVSPTIQRDVTGVIRVDYNDNAAVDASPNGPPDGLFTEGTTITLTSSGGAIQTTTSNGSGAFTFNNVTPGSYTVSVPANIPSGVYPDGLHPSSVQTNPIGIVVVSTNVTANFYITPYYRITGGVFLDVNKNGRKEVGESYYSGGAITLTNSNGGTISYPASGLYTVASVPYGTHTVTYTSAIPNGYVITIPQGGAGSPSFTVQVGRDCAATPVSPVGGDGACGADGNVSDVNFGISNSTPWIQGIGLDMRFDAGLTNQIPSLSNACGNIYTMMPKNAADTTTQGGIFIGNSSKNNAFGVRQSPSSEGWVMDTLFPETYKPVTSGVIRTSYSYLLGAVTRGGITQTALNTLSGCTDPSISCSLANLQSGVYSHDGDVILSALTIPASRNVIFLIRGNLSLTGAISVPTTSTFTVAVGETAGGTGGDITVDTALGGAPACVPPTGQIQGFFTVDNNFTINGINDCTVGSDTMLTIEGAIVVNASLTTGAFTSNRDLCANDVNYPAVMIKERPDFILHAPDVIKQQNYLFREAAP